MVLPFFVCFLFLSVYIQAKYKEIWFKCFPIRSKPLSRWEGVWNGFINVVENFGYYGGLKRAASGHTFQLLNSANAIRSNLCKCQLIIGLPWWLVKHTEVGVVNLEKVIEITETRVDWIFRGAGKS